MTSSHQKSGFLQGLGAYTIWGVFPLYWYFLSHLSAPEIMANRIVWSFILLLALIGLQGNWGNVRAVLKQRRLLILLLSTSVLISINWLIYIWAVANGHVVEASMGYYINPLFSIVLGALFLQERMRRFQYIALIFAVAGVLFLTIHYGKIPYIALSLAASFGLYGLLRKIAPVDSQVGLLIETAIVFIPAGLYLLFLRDGNHVVFGNVSEQLLLIFSGLVTVLPLVLLANALQLLSLSTIGFLQYISPTLQLLCGVLVFHESFGKIQAISFVLIWIGLLIYTLEAVIVIRRKK